MSIFGNYSYDSIRNIYRSAHELITKIKKAKTEVDEENRAFIKGIFDEILYDSILKTTSGMLKVIFKYSPENTLSAGDIQRYIKKLQTQGINIKYVIIDYLDVLRPTIMNGFYEEHQMLGIITQDLRTLSRIFGIPVITATQTSKLGDDIGRTMNNGLVGESWKKVKFSDFIYL